MNGLVSNYIRDITNALGKSYEIYLNSVGDATVPGTVLFEIDNLRLLASNNAPKFSVIDSTPVGFSITPDNVNSLLNISSGTISFQSNLQIVASNTIPYKQPLSNLDTSYNYYYGGVLYLTYQDFINAQNVYSLIVKTTASAGVSTISVSNVSSIAGLNLPLNAQIQNTFYQIDAVDFINSQITINNVLQNTLLANDKIFINYIPRVKTTMGFPIKKITSFNYSDISGFTYFPSVPRGATEIGRYVIEVIYSGTWSYSVLFYENTYISFPDPSSYTSIFSSQLNALSFANDANNALNTFKQPDFLSKNYSVLQGLMQYTQTLSNNPSISFGAYWATQPFTPTTYFNLGNSFGNLERFDFDKYFIKYYFKTFNIDLAHTFGIFRGDIYDSGTVSTVTINNLLGSFSSDLSSVSSLNKGTYTYGITAVVRSSNVVGESNIQSVSINSNNTSYNYMINSLTWDAPGGTTPDFYNVYRQSNIIGDIFLSKLTTPYQIKYPPSIPNFINNLQIANTSTFQLPNQYLAFQIISNSAYQFTSGGVLLQLKVPDSNSLGISSVIVNNGGANYINPQISAVGSGQNATFTPTIVNGAITSVSITNGGTGFNSIPTLVVNDLNGNGSGAVLTPVLSSIQVIIIEMNPGSPLSLISNSAMYTSNPVYFKDITTAVSTSVAFTFSQPGMTFNLNKDYWIVVEQNFANNTIPSSSSQILSYYNRTTAFPSLLSNDGSTWSAYTPSGQPTTSSTSSTTSLTSSTTTTPAQVTGQAELYFDLLGFVDIGLTGTQIYSKGVKLTGDIANIPKRLSVYVPTFDSSVYSYFNLPLSDNLAISNSLTVTVVARNGENGIPVTLTGNINQGTLRGVRIPLGGLNDVFDRVDNVIVSPNISAGVTYGSDNLIKWSVKDFITVETTP